MEPEEIPGLTSQEEPEKQKWQISSRTKKTAAVFLLVFVILLITLTALTAQTAPKKPSSQIPVITPPYFVVTSTPAPLPSRYSTDSAVLKIENDLKNLETELLNVDLTESFLNLPNIDLKVTWQK